MVFEALLGIFLPIILGYLFQKINYIPSSLAPGLRLFVIRIAIPALVFQNLYSAELSELKQFLPLVLSLFIFTAFAWILAWLLTSIPAFRKRRMENILLIIFSNVGFMGWAVISQLLGPQGLRRGIFFTSLWMVNLYLYSYIS
nr:AEC family transporter [Spirochaetaceae bacterium]